MPFKKFSLYFPLVLSVLLASCTYRQDYGILSWENDIKELERLDANQEDPKNAILFTGSSSIRLWDNIHEDLKPYPIIQRGYGGARLTDFSYYCKRIVYPHDVRAIAIFVANDITGGPEDKSPQEVLGLYKNVVKQIRKKFKDTPIFFIEITPTNSRWEVWDKIREANRLIKEYSKENEFLYYVDTNDAFFGEDGKPRSELFRHDQLHLNADGYKIWSRIILDNLNKVLK